MRRHFGRVSEDSERAGEVGGDRYHGFMLTDSGPENLRHLCDYEWPVTRSAERRRCFMKVLKGSVERFA